MADVFEVVGSFTKIFCNQATISIEFVNGALTLLSDCEVTTKIQDDELQIIANTESRYVASNGKNNIIINGQYVTSNVCNFGNFGVSNATIQNSFNNYGVTTLHPEKYSKTWTIVSVPKINCVTVLGGGGLNFVDDLFGKSLAVTVTGSGKVITPRLELNTLSVNLTGSGSINFNKSTTSSVMVNLTGSGSVSNFYAIKFGEFRITGSGSIKGKVTPTCYTNKNTMGSGSIDLTKE